MLQHFLDMANAKTMNENTLTAGVKSVVDYMKDQSMMPTPKGATGPTAQATPKFNVGDSVMYNGAQHKIKSIDPASGKLTLEP